MITPTVIQFLGLMLAATTTPTSADPIACAPRSPETMVTPNDATCRPLEGGALRTLLRDAYVSPVRGPGLVSNPPGEVFMYNGAYERRVISRRNFQGTYSIEGNAVCVEGPDFGRRCRRVFVALDGIVYLFVDVEDGSATTMTVSPLR